MFRRALQDSYDATNLADKQARPEDFPHLLCQYKRPLIEYPGQETQFAGKQRNNEIALRAIDCLLISPQETFSFWRCVGRPTKQAGYADAAAIKNQTLTLDMGGALCLASTLLYNIGLLSGLTIIERRCHSVDSYGDQRYFELGRDASVEFAYIDLRFRNDLGFPVMLRSRIESNAVVAEAWSALPVDLIVDIRVEIPALEQQSATVAGEMTPAVLLHAKTRRKVTLNGRSWNNDLGASTYHT